MEAISEVMVAVLGFIVGLHYDRLRKSIADLKESLKTKADTKKPDTRISAFIDPLDITLRAKMEHEENMKKLNPNG